MVLSNPLKRAARTGTTATLCAVLLALGACSVTGPRESPLNEVTKDSPSALDIYRNTPLPTPLAPQARENLQTQGNTMAITAQDARKSPYWSPLEPLRSRFTRVPNPDLVMVVYPHLAKGKYPVPGYVTVFPMYEENLYALPGEIEQDAIATGAHYNAQRSANGSKDGK
jgi:conjugative transfer region lipoprotein (TIGR03751 family)